MLLVAKIQSSTWDPLIYLSINGRMVDVKFYLSVSDRDVNGSVPDRIHGGSGLETVNKKIELDSVQNPVS